MMLRIYPLWVKHNFIFFTRSTSSTYVNPWLEQLTAQIWRTNTVWHSELHTDTMWDAKPCLTVTLSKVLCGGKTDLSCCSLVWTLAYDACVAQNVCRRCSYVRVDDRKVVLVLIISVNWAENSNIACSCYTWHLDTDKLYFPFWEKTYFSCNTLSFVWFF